MSRTRLAVAAALAIIALSAGLVLARRAVLGADVAGPRGRSAWKVTLKIAGRLDDKHGSVTLALPPDFRRQHVFDEQFDSPALMPPRKKEPDGRDPGRREITWKRTGVGGALPFELTYSFRCVLGMRDPTPQMHEVTALADAAPVPGRDTRPGPGVESDAPEITAKAAELTGDAGDPADRVGPLYRYVCDLEDVPALESPTALGCLRREAGDPLGKARLLVALCRNRGLPARLVAGAVLSNVQTDTIEHWAEAWLGTHWVPMDPTHRHFGEDEFPPHTLVFWLGDGTLMRGAAEPREAFLATRVSRLGAVDGGPLPPVHEFLLRHSFDALRPAEQHLVRFLVLMPLAALVVAVCRTIVGVRTFGTFSPALLGLAFLDLKALPVGLGIFLLTVLVGWGLRHLLDLFNLLLVPRTAVLLTLIVGFLTLVVVAGHAIGLRVTHYLALFPLVILTHLVERFWTLEAEDGTVSAFKALGGTALVAVAVSLCLNVPGVGNWVYRYPETLLGVVGVLILLGRYGGYRLTELGRFRDLVEVPSAAAAVLPLPPLGGSPVLSPAPLGGRVRVGGGGVLPRDGEHPLPQPSPPRGEGERPPPPSGEGEREAAAGGKP
jgi:hypothetical protein